LIELEVPTQIVVVARIRVEPSLRGEHEHVHVYVYEHVI
jgi:hypothetical protein